MTSTDYRFESNSTYTFNAGLAGAQFFDLSGTFTLNEFPTGGATITNAVLGLSPNPSNLNLNLPLTSPAGVANLLETNQFGLVPSIGTQTTYQSFLSLDFPSDPFEITVDNVSANRPLTFSGTGSNDLIPIFADGTSFEFSATATAVAVPEPTALPACLLLGITIVARRVRGTSFSPAQSKDSC